MQSSILKFAVAVSLFALMTAHTLAQNAEQWRALRGPQGAEALALFSQGQGLFAGTLGGGIYRSTDRAASWTAVNTGLPANLTVNAFAANGANLFAATSQGVYRSTDGGQSWTKTNTGQATQEVLALAASGTNLFAATRGDGVLLSTDQGASWRPINVGLTNRVIRSLAIHGPLLFASAQSGGLFVNDAIAQVASVSAASFDTEEVAAESIVAAFSAGLATASVSAATQPLLVALGGASVTIRDSQGQERAAPLFFVSPNQINYQLPPGAATGPATVIVTSANGKVSLGTARIVTTAPGLFAANGKGQGVAAAIVLRVKAGGAQSYEPVARFDAAQNAFVCAPIELGPASDQLFLILYGTGLRLRSSLDSMTATIGGTNVEVLFAGPLNGLIGLDQVNLRLPRSLAGRSAVSVTLTVDGKLANPVTLCIR